MKSLYVVTGNTESNTNTMCDLLQNKLPVTAFPGCWDMDHEATEKDKENIIVSVSRAINYLINAPEHENIIFGWGIYGQRVINKLLSRIETNKCELNVINYIEAEKLVSEHKI